MSFELSTQDLPDVRKKNLPGDEGIWVVIFGEMVVFAVLFFVFLDARSHDVAGFRAGKATLDITLGIINTLLLLTSSFLVAVGIEIYRRGIPRHARILFLMAASLGIAFCTIKGFEYYAKLSEGFVLFDHPFFIYYFVLTGLHLVHVLIGIGLLLAMSAFAGRSATVERQALFESGGLFWHLVDLLWIVIFPLLYILH